MFNKPFKSSAQQQDFIKLNNGRKAIYTLGNTNPRILRPTATRT